MLAYGSEASDLFGLNAQKSYVSLYVGTIEKIDNASVLLAGFDSVKGCIRIKSPLIFIKPYLRHLLSKLLIYGELVVTLPARLLPNLMTIFRFTQWLNKRDRFPHTSNDKMPWICFREGTARKTFILSSRAMLSASVCWQENKPSSPWEWRIYIVLRG